MLARANEIMARLNREAAEDEEKKQREIEAAKEKAAEQERLAAILKSTERNIDAFIQEGLSKQHRRYYAGSAGSCQARHLQAPEHRAFLTAMVSLVPHI